MITQDYLAEIGRAAVWSECAEAAQKAQSRLGEAKLAGDENLIKAWQQELSRLHKLRASILKRG